MPRSRTSLLNESSSCALASTVVAAAVAAFVCSSVDIVDASTSATAVPFVTAKPCSDARTFSLSLVKSWTTCSVEEMAAIATRSAVDIFSCAT
jgi:hypothetical protein